MHDFLNKCYIVGMLCLRKRHATALLREGVQNVGLVRGPYSHVGHMPTVWKNILGRHFSIWVPNYGLWDRTCCRVANMA